MPSRTSKKAWRKRKDATTDVEEGLEEATQHEHHGTDFDLVPNADLFFEDKSGSAKPAADDAPVGRRKPRKALKSEAILLAGHAARPIRSRTAKPARTAKAVKRAAPQQTEQGSGEVAELDLWGDRASQPGTAPKRARSGRPAGVARPAVEVDQPGCSYNPDAVQHQDAIASAVAAEVSKQLAAELAPKPTAALADGIGAHQQDELRLLQVDEAADDPLSDGEAADGAGVDRRMPAPKTKTQRNKEERRRQAEAELKARKQQKGMAKSLNQLKQLAAELDAEEEVKAAKALRKQISKLEKQAEAPPRLGKTRFAPEPVHVLLSEELHGSLRGLKPSAMLARDRFKSLQKRGLLEPRTRVRKHVGKRFASDTYANRQADRELMA